MIHSDLFTEIEGHGKGYKLRALCHLTYLIVIIQAITMVNKYFPFLYVDTCTSIKTKLNIMYKAMLFESNH